MVRVALSIVFVLTSMHSIAAFANCSNGVEASAITEIRIEADAHDDDHIEVDGRRWRGSESNFFRHSVECTQDKVRYTVSSIDALPEGCDLVIRLPFKQTACICTKSGCADIGSKPKVKVTELTAKPEAAR